MIRRKMKTVSLRIPDGLLQHAEDRTPGAREAREAPVRRHEDGQAQPALAGQQGAAPPQELGGYKGSATKGQFRKCSLTCFFKV